ncbi:MAG: hypothetical protein JWN04_3014 [Myxococcaceae bacterium]|nr:hypothetical protein [Myxococcaceae bacterium]
MTAPIEQVRGKRRLASKRLSDMGEGEGSTSTQPRPGAPVGNNNATYAASKRAARRALETIAGVRITQATGEPPMPEESRHVADSALALAADAVREVGCPSPFVEYHSQRFGLNASLAGSFTQRAAEAGFASERGLLMLEAAHRCETMATRAMVAAEAAAKSFGRSRKGKTLDLAQVIEAASQERKR